MHYLGHLDHIEIVLLKCDLTINKLLTIYTIKNDLQRSNDLMILTVDKVMTIQNNLWWSVGLMISEIIKITTISCDRNRPGDLMILMINKIITIGCDLGRSDNLEILSICMTKRTGTICKDLKIWRFPRSQNQDDLYDHQRPERPWSEIKIS